MGGRRFVGSTMFERKALVGQTVANGEGGLPELKSPRR